MLYFSYYNLQYTEKFKTSDRQTGCQSCQTNLKGKKLNEQQAQ